MRALLLVSPARRYVHGAVGCSASWSHAEHQNYWDVSNANNLEIQMYFVELVTQARALSTDIQLPYEAEYSYEYHPGERENHLLHQ
ncbi:hypothetical protein F4780DRAFT_666882 [Xylariomycetidae sp. FL0641]|nr:hypothetical protein F4780DRAFT_666882 [Xylariomycetidae sp. FL0641]